MRFRPPDKYFKVSVKLFSIFQDKTQKNVLVVCQLPKHLIRKINPSLYEEINWRVFENYSEIRETSPVLMQNNLQQQLTTFCIPDEEDARAQETTGRKGSQILWKLYLQQWSLPRKNKISLHLFLLRMRCVPVCQCPRNRRKKRWCCLVADKSPSANTCTCPRVSVMCTVWKMNKEKVV